MNAEEMKVVIGVNYIMSVAQLLSVTMYWKCDKIF